MTTLQHLPRHIAIGIAAHKGEREFVRFCLAWMLFSCLAWRNAFGWDMPSSFAPKDFRRATDSREKKMGKTLARGIKQQKNQKIKSEKIQCTRHIRVQISVCVKYMTEYAVL